MKKIHPLRPLDDDARERAASCVAMAHQLAIRLARGGFVPLDVATDTALDALLDAARNYRYDGGASFPTYCFVCIRCRMAGLVRKYASQCRRMLHAIPFSALAGYDEDTPFDPSDREPTAEAPDPQDVRAVLERVKSVLPERLYSILRMRHLEGLTLREVSARLGITKERIRQITAHAIRRVRKALPDCVLGEPPLPDHRPSPRPDRVSHSTAKRAAFVAEGLARGATYREMATSLGCSVANVQHLVKLARRETIAG